MSYLKAEQVLPKELIETIQQYVDGAVLYIPSKEKRVWGSRTSTKQYYEDRNEEIYAAYIDGATVKELAEQFALSEKSIQRILRAAKGGENR